MLLLYSKQDSATYCTFTGFALEVCRAHVRLQISEEFFQARLEFSTYCTTLWQKQLLRFWSLQFNGAFTQNHCYKTSTTVFAE